MSAKTKKRKKVASVKAKNNLPPVDENAQRYFNRELSWLEFNRRVLAEAQDPTTPPLERIKFTAIFGSNLDEFFMTRVAGIKQQISAGVVNRTADGMTPAEELIAIRDRLSPMLTQVRTLLRDELLPLLQEKGLYLLEFGDLAANQHQVANDFFSEQVFPVLTPLAFDPGRPFPHISNLSLNLAVRVHNPKLGEKFARLKVPSTLPRIVPLPAPPDEKDKNKRYFIWLEQIVIANIDMLFPGLDVLEVHPFRITRNADMVIQEDEASDLLHTIEASLRRRHFGPVVRLTIDEAMPSHIKELLKRNLEIDDEDIFPVEGALGLSDLMSIYSIDRPGLKFEPFAAVTPPDLRGLAHRSELFKHIRHHDILLHHPYHSFVPIIDFLKAAARDPNVLAIKQTLYRVGQDSPIVQALMEARENGKEVAVLVELKARFDEESNIGWARALEKVGVHVVYGLMGLKTHSKITLVIRKEKDGLRRYLHLGTGNYNAATAQTYTDLGLLTCNEAFGRDASHLFNFLTGYSGQNTYDTLLVAPTTLREQMEKLIRREIKQHKKHGQGRLIFKMNALVDPAMIDVLYEASQAGVEIDLLVRGICCLRPQVAKLSENIRVVSVVGRYLEHSRIFYFHNGGDEELYLGSADLMQRNLNWRVETVFPITDTELMVYIRDKILARCLKDNVQARVLQADGTYKRLSPSKDEPAFNSQLEFMRHAAEPHRTTPVSAAD